MSSGASQVTSAAASAAPPARGSKAIYFILEGINAYATAYYFNYLFFLLRDQFGFGNRENLAVSAAHGLIYFFAAWAGGTFAERKGFLTSLWVGFGGMAVVLIGASQIQTAPGQLLAMGCWTMAMLFTWPALEALICERETPQGLQRMVGIYNCVWAGCSAMGYFTGGAVFDSLGVQSLYWLPVALHASQMLILAWWCRQPAGAASNVPHHATPFVSPQPHAPEPGAFRQPISPRIFLRMAWLANPFAYIAINTVLAVIPGLARRFDFSVTESGVFCSIWFFTRLAAFVALWQWNGWHYRFRWLAGSFLVLILSFATLLLVGQLWLLIFAQIAFGLAIGLIYYSSLFYSMDVGETKGEHGGWHEAMIGAGICVGPAIGATALQLAPYSANAGTWAVSAVLVGGLGGLLWLRGRK